MEEGLFPIRHQLLIISNTKVFGGQPSWKETWKWEVFSTTVGDKTLIRCTSLSNGRKSEIPWFETEELDSAPIIKEKCLEYMKKNM